MQEKNLIIRKIENIYFDLQNDPVTRKKFLFYLVSAVTFVFLIVVLLYFSQGESQNEVKSLIEEKEVNQSVATKTSEIKFHESSPGVIVKSDGVVGLNNQGAFVYKNIETSEKGINVSPNGENYIINSSDVDGDKVLINTNEQKTFLFKEKKLHIYPENLIQLIPVKKNSSESGFYAILRDFDGVNVFLYDKIDLTGFETKLAPIPQVGSTYLELASFNNRPYVFIWNGSNLSIHSINTETKSLERIYYIENIVSTLRGSNKILFTKKIGDKNQNFVIDFTIERKGTQILLDFEDALKENKIDGSVFARRCSFYKNFELVCLVKEKRVSTTDETVADKIFIFNYVKSETSFPYPNLLIAGLEVYVDEQNDIYVFETSQKIIYKLAKI